MAKPSTYPDWINDDDVTKIETPSASKQLEGWLSGEKPPFQYFNWFWNLVSKWLQYFSRVTIEHNILIDTALHEGDYTTLAAYLADSPAAGDRVYIGLDETVTAKLTIPAGVKLKLMKGKKLSCASNLTTIIEFGDNCETEGDFVIECSHTGTTAEAVSINGDNNHHTNIVVKNTSTGTITAAFIVESGQKGNLLRGEVINSGGGTITASLNDASTVLSNDIVIRNEDADLMYEGDGALPGMGITATAAEINNTCDDGKYGTQGIILGDTTAGRVIRMITIAMVDGTNPDTVKAQTLQEWNGDVIAAEDNISKGGSTTSFSLSAGGDILTIKGTALSGTVVGAFISLRSTPSTDLVTVVGGVSGGDIALIPKNGTGVTQDWGAIVDSGSASIGILYVTNA